MGFLPTTTCRRCHRQYTALRGRCPHCGTRKPREVSRVAATTASTVKGTAAQTRAKTNAQWQMMFGGILVFAVILAVIVLISTSLKGGEGTGDLDVLESPSPDVVETLPPTTPPPTEPPVEITSVTFTYSGAPLAFENQFSTAVGAQTQLGVSYFPVDAVVTPEWRSSNNDIMTVDQTGMVTGVSSGWATLYVKVGTAEAACEVWVQ